MTNLSNEETARFETAQEKILDAAGYVARLRTIYSSTDNGPAIARTTSIAITKLEEAELWLGKAREEAKKS